MTLSEYATVGATGELTMFRGGLCRWTVQEFPVVFSVFAVVQIPPRTLSSGSHPFSVTVRDPNSLTVTMADGGLTIADASAPCNIAFPIQVNTSAEGVHVVEVQAASERGRWEFRVDRREGGIN
jgi:hypothetical protein